MGVGGLVENNRQVMQDEDGLWWFYTGTYPYAVSPGVDPYDDPLWYCVGLLNGKEISDLSSWCDTVSNVDVTFEMQQFFRTLGYLGIKAFGAGAVTVSSRITIPNVEFDFSDLKVTIDPDSDDSVSGNGGRVFTITDPETIILTGQAFTTSNVGQINTIQLSGDGFRNCSVGIQAETSNDNAYLRYGTAYTKKADIYVMDDSGTGFHGATPSLYKYNDTATLTVRPIRNQHINRAPKFILPQPLSAGRKLRTCIRIERNNVTVVGGNMNAQAAGMYVESMYELNSVIDCEFIHTLNIHPGDFNGKAN